MPILAIEMPTEPKAVDVAKSAEVVERKARMWNCWTRYSRRNDGVITHVLEEGTANERAGRAICGVRVSEGGGINMALDDGYTPGCSKCRNLLQKWGLMPSND